MDDARIWSCEEALDSGRRALPKPYSDTCLMVRSKRPFDFSIQPAIDEVQLTPRWDSVTLSQRLVSRLQEGLIVIACHASAEGGKESNEASCKTTYQRIAHEDSLFVQHRQTPPAVTT